MIPSINADFNNHIYESIYVIGDTNQTITLNGINYSLSPKTKINFNVVSIDNANENVLLLGYNKPIFPIYLGNPPNTNNNNDTPILDLTYWDDNNFWVDNNFWNE